jgi:hypothetical protein
MSHWSKGYGFILVLDANRDFRLVLHPQEKEPKNAGPLAWERWPGPRTCAEAKKAVSIEAVLSIKRRQ